MILIFEYSILSAYWESKQYAVRLVNMSEYNIYFLHNYCGVEIHRSYMDTDISVV